MTKAVPINIFGGIPAWCWHFLLFFVLSLFPLFTASVQAQGHTPSWHDEYGRKLDYAGLVSPLKDDVFGEKVNIYNGAVTFSATDVVLAAFLARNLRQGGFAQLIFNAQGQYLGEMAKMLQNMNASNTLHFYEQAVRVCLADKAGYQSFLSSDYVGALAVKNPLHEVSMDYYESSPQFAQEAWPSLSKTCVTATQSLNENQPETEPQA